MTNKTSDRNKKNKNQSDVSIQRIKPQNQSLPDSKFKFAANATGQNKDWDLKKLAKNFRDKEKHYPHSDRCINLSKPCPYCDYGRGLIIIRFKDDIGFCKCGRCDAALYSLPEVGEVAK